MLLRDIKYETFQQSLSSKYQEIMSEREKIVEAFIAETGLKPSEIELVEERTMTGAIWYVRKREEL